ncbi:MAG: hypothetical protein JJ895_01315 [Balneolaceae bacterium]|nr:hypothetical protein [Balneolaceae bacterium]
MISCSGGDIGVTTSPINQFSEGATFTNFSNIREILFSDTNEFSVREVTQFTEVSNTDKANISINNRYIEFQSIQVFLIAENSEQYFTILILAHNSENVTIGNSNTLPEEFMYINHFYDSVVQRSEFIGINYQMGDLWYSGILDSNEFILTSNKIEYSFKGISMDLYNFETSEFYENKAIASGILRTTSYRIEQVSFD